MVPDDSLRIWPPVVDAVIGGDTHRDSQAPEMTAPAGVTIAALSVRNDEVGFAEALAWIAEHAPGSRVVVALEGARSYGIGQAGRTSATIRTPRLRSSGGKGDGRAMTRPSKSLLTKA